MTEENETPDMDYSGEDYRHVLNASARLLSAKRPGEALELLTSLHEKLPNDPDVAINRGGALILQRKWDMAVKALLPAARQNMNNAMLWTNLAAAYLGSLETSGPKQQQQAITAYEQALRANPQTSNVHYHLALIYKEQGNLARASALFQRALEVNPNDKDAARWLEHLSKLIVTTAQDDTSDLSSSDSPPPTDETE